MTVPDVQTARAEDRACALYSHHAPRVVRTEGHHRHPVYLQNKAYGRIQDPELLVVGQFDSSVCGLLPPDGDGVAAT